MPLDIDNEPAPLMSNVIITERIPAAKKLCNEIGISANSETNPIKKQQLLTDFKKQKQKVQFLEALQEDLLELNNFINDYNALVDPTEKLKQLHAIHQKQQQIEYKYPSNAISSCPSYQQAIHFTLFNELKQQFASLGIKSLHKDALNAGPQRIGAMKTQPTTFAEILANMAPEKVSNMLELLSKGALYDQKHFLNLYHDEDTEEAQVFKKFFTTHSIEFLGGSNSKNFKINAADSSSYVLKVENRLTMPKDAEIHLRQHSLSDKLTPIHAERQSTYTTLESPITRSVLITEFCNNGNLEDHTTQCANDKERVKSAFNLYGQMGDMLEKIQQDGVAFPDMKNTNWLIDGNGILRIADSKSLAFADGAGNLDYNFAPNKWYQPLQTYYVSPPELITREDPPSIDKLHSYMMGKNLYQYLSTCNSDYLGEYMDGKLFDFKKPIFQTNQGKQLKELIIKMTNPNPNQRIGLTEALFKLKNIPIEPLKKECHSMLLDLQTKGVGEQDIAMKKFLLQKTTEINSTANEDELNKLKHELMSIIFKVKDDSNIKSINSCIRNAPLFTKNMNHRLDQIITKMASIPITERNTESDSVIEVQKDLAAFNELKLQMITCHAYLNEIKAFELTPADTEMTKFIQKKKDEIAQINTVDQIDTMVKELKSTIDQLTLKYNPIVSTIKSYYDKASLLSIGMKAKGSRIEEAMLKVPIEERHRVMEADTLEASNVREALDSSRSLWKKKPEPASADKPTPIESFKTLKSKFQGMDKSANTDEAAPGTTTKGRK
jgi:serine/threonine protein kinase